MSAKFQFDSMGIGRLLKQGRMSVPPNQRPYAWEEKHVRDLFTDLNEALIKDDDDYFLGTVVLIQTDRETPSIADGQQRLATTTVLLARIRDHLIRLNRQRSARSLDESFLRNIDVDTEETVPRIKLNIEDNDFFARFVLPCPEDDGYRPVNEITAVRPSNKRLLRASQIADEFVLDTLRALPASGHAEHLIRWMKFLDQSATVVVVIVPDEIGAFRIFETLNDRGLKASQADILKNYFFSKAGGRLAEAQMLWNLLTATLETLGDEDGDRLVTYLRHFWVTTHGQTKERELAAQIKAEIAGETRTMQFLSDASSAVNDYVALWSSRHPKWASYKPTTRQHLETLSEHLRVEQIRPLLFAVARHFDPVEADKAFRLFVGWSVRFLIYGGRGGMLDSQYSQRAKDVGTGRITKARELREAMKPYVPSDAEFEEAFASARVARPHLARYYLRALEKTLKDDPHPEYVANEDVRDVNLEHVLPLNPDLAWAVTPEEAEAAQRLLGNMVLLRSSRNQELGNRAFGEKKAEYASSGYYITRQVAEYDTWTIDQIKKRQADLAKTAVKTWSVQLGD